MALCFASKMFSQATTVNVAGTGSTLTITNAVQTPVDPLLTITADGDLTAFTVTISGSYTAGDILSYTGGVPSGVTAAAFNATTRSLVFSGTTTAANWQTLLRTVTITTVSATCFQEQRQVSFVAGNKYYNNLNGHFYENVPGTINWVNALAGASTQSYFGRQGYLATMTSLAETNFIWKIIPSDSWMGASDNNVYINAATGTTTYATNTGPGSSDGRWYWVSGPEKGTLFSVGHSSPTTQPGQFAYWNPGEPNGSGGGEDCGQFYSGSGGHWNDLNFSRTLASYIVEYGGMSTDNVGANVVFTRDLLLLGAPSGTITGGNTTVCSTVNNTTLTLTGLISGGTVVKWQYSYDDFLTAGIDIVNTTTTHTVTNINQNTYYRTVVNTPGCTGLTTSSTRINVDSAVAGNIVADNNTICVNANVNFTLNGNSGNVTKWQVSTSSTFASSVTDIANTTSAMSYQLTGAGTYYFRAVIESCSNTVYTSGYTISCIAGTAPAGGTISNASFCNGSNSGTLTLSGHTGTITKWQYSIDGGIVWSDIVNTTNTYNFSGITTTRKYRALLTSGTCGTAWSSVGLVSVNNLAPSLSYSVSGTQNYVLNSAISSLGITNSGGSVLDGNYSVLPALPTGLILEADGAISGTPTVTSAATTYSITGTNGCNSDTATVEIATGTTPTLSDFSNINRTYYDGSYAIAAPTSNSSGAFSYTSSNTAVATISGTTVIIQGVGTTTITANQGIDASYTNGSIAATLTVSSIAVMSKNGQNTTTGANYVSKNGAIASGVGITINGEVTPTLTPIPLQNSLHINAANSQYLTFTKPSSLNATGDFTFETWIKFNSIGAGTMDPIFGGGRGDYFSVYSNNFAGRIDVNNPCSADRNFFSSSLLDTTSWHHIAVVRSGSTITAYLDGVARGTTNCTGTFMNSLSTVYIGRNTWRPGYLDAYISNMRYVVGTAVYTANFTPPTSVLTAIPGTEFLLLANDVNFPFKDSSPNNITVNEFGSPTLALGNGPF